MAGSSGEKPKPVPGQKKVCHVCHESKLLNQFARGDGQWERLPYCKACSKLLVRDKQKPKHEQVYPQFFELAPPVGMKPKHEQVYPQFFELAPPVTMKRRPGRKIKPVKPKKYRRLSKIEKLVMYEAVNGYCEVCRRHFEIRGMVVDHDHSQEAIDAGTATRGILCITCNASIGGLGDSIERLESAITYLKKYQQPKKG